MSVANRSVPQRHFVFICSVYYQIFTICRYIILFFENITMVERILFPLYFPYSYNYDISPVALHGYWTLFDLESVSEISKIVRYFKNNAKVLRKYWNLVDLLSIEFASRNEWHVGNGPLQDPPSHRTGIGGLFNIYSPIGLQPNISFCVPSGSISVSINKCGSLLTGTSQVPV